MADNEQPPPNRFIARVDETRAYMQGGILPPPLRSVMIAPAAASEYYMSADGGLNAQAAATVVSACEQTTGNVGLITVTLPAVLRGIMQQRHGRVPGITELDQLREAHDLLNVAVGHFNANPSPDRITPEQLDRAITARDTLQVVAENAQIAFTPSRRPAADPSLLVSACASILNSPGTTLLMSDPETPPDIARKIGTLSRVTQQLSAELSGRRGVQLSEADHGFLSDLAMDLHEGLLVPGFERVFPTTFDIDVPQDSFSDSVHGMIDRAIVHAAHMANKLSSVAPVGPGDEKTDATQALIAAITLSHQLGINYDDAPPEVGHHGPSPHLPHISWKQVTDTAGKLVGRDPQRTAIDKACYQYFPNHIPAGLIIDAHTERPEDIRVYFDEVPAILARMLETTDMKLASMQEFHTLLRSGKTLAITLSTAGHSSTQPAALHPLFEASVTANRALLSLIELTEVSAVTQSPPSIQDRINLQACVNTLGSPAYAAVMANADIPFDTKLQLETIYRVAEKWQQRMAKGEGIKVSDADIGFIRETYTLLTEALDVQLLAKDFPSTTPSNDYPDMLDGMIDRAAAHAVRQAKGIPSVAPIGPGSEQADAIQAMAGITSLLCSVGNTQATAQDLGPQAKANAHAAVPKAPRHR